MLKDCDLGDHQREVNLCSSNDSGWPPTRLARLVTGWWGWASKQGYRVWNTVGLAQNNREVGPFRRLVQD